ncbi:MAG: pseudouridine synthase [cyanobacterium endosymbiont of Rhopalodia musculus]|uniref:pseudouridine synthase n=1 Tax=cyanobacterium endosymbiont of Epithemia clementina EcSB TaxID=3034674 RepID=UPI0024803853|nr:pseudouridine synthase [cyanobacterium endosymbiont of Epithemia clementina EcSB]WGT66668.1 pseudouridine synthase [cyanobacterium endosymbiont of Epithemia clementina EcSB]
MKERVQKILSQWGIASRRKAEKLILAGRVKLNGHQVQLGEKADPKYDRLEVDSQIIQPAQRPNFLYILLNKPQRVVSTCDDPQHRPTVLDLLPKKLCQGTGVHPVGRLDFNSTGALLLTNDGELTLNLTHPRYHLPKTYEVVISGNIPETRLQQWREGVMLMGKKTLPAQVKVIHCCPHQQTHLQVVITEGRNRQIRRIVQQMGCNILRLHRSAIGSITIDSESFHESSLPSGHYRLLTTSEIDFLRSRPYLITETFQKLS